MSKTIKYGTNGAVLGGIAFLLFNFFKQQARINENPNLEFDWGEFLKEGGKGALIVGGTGAVIGGMIDWKNDLEQPLDTNALIGVAVQKAKLDKTSFTYQELSRKADNITNLIETNFKGKLGGHILRIGSTEDNTALSENFDIDLSVPFNAKSYSSIAVMFDEVQCFIEDAYHDTDLVKIRTQKKSIGLLFEIRREEFKIDVVPYKLSKRGKNKTSGYLFVNNNSLFGNDSYTKTDIASLKGVRLNVIQQKLLIALKNWKQNYSVPISSHLLRLLILDAYTCNRGFIPRGLTKKLLMLIEHIEGCITYKRIVSVENTNNVLTDIPDSDKEIIRQKCEDILKDYKYQPNSILVYFE